MNLRQEHHRIHELLVTALLFAAFSVSDSASAQFSDNFNDGNDSGWTRYSPLEPGNPSGNVAPIEFSFPNGGYRIRTTNSTGNSQNPARGGSVRLDQTFSNNFYVAVDVVDWKDDTRQAFGLLARVNNPGLFTTRGYAFTYERGSGVTMTSGDTDLSRIDCVMTPQGTFCEVPFGIGTGPSGIHLNPSNDYRFVFIGIGGSLEGRIYELPNTRNPILSIAGFDEVFASGHVGLVVYDNAGGNGVVDATFDNFLVQDIEPPPIGIQREPFDEISVVWPLQTDGFVLQFTRDLSTTPIVWTDITSGIITNETQKVYGDSLLDGVQKFYRLVRP